MEALILKTRPVGESDLRVSLLTNDGQRMCAYARGVREPSSKLRAGLMPLTISDVGIVAGRQRLLAKSVVPLLTFPELNLHPAGQATAVFVHAMLEPKSDAGSDRRLYAETTKRLRDLHTAILARESTLLIVRRTLALWVRLFEGVGFMPDFMDDEISITKSARAQLIRRRIPNDMSDIRTLTLFLMNHAEKYIPNAQKDIKWAVSRILVPKDVIPSPTNLLTPST